MGLFDERRETEHTASSYSDAVEEEYRRAKRTGRMNLIALVLVIAGFMAFQALRGGSSVSPAVLDGGFGVVTLEKTTLVVPYQGVESLELRSPVSGFDRGERISGQETAFCCSGAYRNDEFGEYQLHVNLRAGNYLVARYDGGVLVFNADSPDGTEQLYAQLLKLIAENTREPVSSSDSISL